MKRVLVVGLGAVGTVFATFLKEAGNIVYALVKDSQIEHFSDGKIRVDGIWGEHVTQLDGVFSKVESLSDINFDLIILAVKSYDTEDSVKFVKELVKEGTLLLLTQNGYGNYERAVEYVSKEKVLLGRVIFGAKVNYPGYVTVTVNADDVRIGQPEGLGEEKGILETVCTIKHAGIPASYSRDVYKILWDKILYNCALNPLGAILEKTYGELADNQDTTAIMNSIIREIFQVCRLKGIELNFKTPEDYIDHFYTNLIPPTRQHYPSMYYDLKSGRKTEIEALNGAVVELGRSVGYIPIMNLTISTIIRGKSLKV